MRDAHHIAGSPDVASPPHLKDKHFLQGGELLNSPYWKECTEYLLCQELLSKSPLDSLKPSASHFYCTKRKRKQIMSKVLQSVPLSFYLKPFSLSETFYHTPSSSFYISYFSIPLIVHNKTSKIQNTMKSSNHKDAALHLTQKNMSQLWLYSAWSEISTHSKTQPT